jgi:hypothetical protein
MNHAPSLTAQPLTVGQGETASVKLAPQDPDNDAVVLSVVFAPEGLSAGVGADGVTLSVRADYTLSGQQLVTVHLDDGHGGTADVRLAVTVTPLLWQWHDEVDATGPTTREHGTWVLDADHDVAYLIGGSGYAPQGTPAVDDYWKLDLKTRAFTQLPATGAHPKAAASRRAANLPDKKIAYLLGGYDSETTDTNELWSFDYSVDPPVFTLLQQMNPPPARELHAFAYDPGTDTFVCFGGVGDPGTLFKDTWTMKLSNGVATWTQLDIPGPTRRYGFFFGMDETLGRLYVWSGAQGLASINAAQDLWMLDLRASGGPSWLRLLGGTEPGSPLGRRNGAFVFDPNGPRMFVFGGTADGMTTVPGLNVLDLSTSPPQWFALTLQNQPPIRSSDFGFYDPARKQDVMSFGNSNATYRDVFALGY